MDLFTIRVSHLELCVSPACPFESPAHQHLVVRTQTVQLAQEAAVAISYAWGKFNRQKRVIGHHPDGSPVEMVLGVEWEGPDFVTALHNICEETSRPCWIDQLSIMQNDDEDVKKTLARIPDVYRTLHVVALLPGPMCECKAERVSFVQDGPGVEGTNPIKCWNNLGLASYFGRLWTRQELHYARSVRARWTSSKLAVCTEKVVRNVNSDFQRLLYRWDMVKKPDQLSPLARQWALQELLGRLHAAKGALVDEGKTWDELAEGAQDTAAANVYELAGITIMIEADAAYKAAAFSLANWEDLHSVNPSKWGGDREGILKRFLRGETLTENLRDASLTQQQRLLRFLTQASVLGSEQRSTTQERDLVLAIWPDCPRYEIPGGYRDIPLPDLLEDAVLQLEQKWKVSFVTFKPSGLFTTAQDTQDALLWRPASNTRSGTTTTQVYQGFSALPCFYSIPNYHLWSLPPTPIPSPRCFKDFELLCHTQPGHATFKFLRIALQQLPVNQLEKVLSHGWTSALMEGLQEDLLTFCRAYRASMADMAGHDKENLKTALGEDDFQRFETMDLHRLVYWIICMCCGVEAEVARCCGLRLVANCNPGPNYARLGLFRVRAEVLNDSETYTITGTGFGFLADQNTPLKGVPPAIEVAIQGPEDGSKVCTDYRILGVWGPLRVCRARDRLHIAQGYVPTLGHNALQMSEDYLKSEKFSADLKETMFDYVTRVEEARGQTVPTTISEESLTTWSEYRRDIWVPRDQDEQADL